MNSDVRDYCHLTMPALQSKNAVCAFQIAYKLPSFTLEDSRRYISRRSSALSITKGSIIPHQALYIQPFTTLVDWPDIGCLMEVSINMFEICRYCFFIWKHKTRLSFVITQTRKWIISREVLDIDILEFMSLLMTLVVPVFL